MDYELLDIEMCAKRNHRKCFDCPHKMSCEKYNKGVQKAYKNFKVESRKFNKWLKGIK